MNQLHNSAALAPLRFPAVLFTSERKRANAEWAEIQNNNKKKITMETNEAKVVLEIIGFQNFCYFIGGD